MNATRAKAEPIRTCACWRCNIVVAKGDLMCRPHWLSLPRPLRTAILETWKARHMRAHQANVQQAMNMIAEREGVFQDVFGGAFETQPSPAGGGSPHSSPSPANFVVPPFGGVAS